MIVKSSQIYCKKCQTTICNNKVSKNKASNSKVYKMRLNKNTKSLTEAINVTRRYIGRNVFNIIIHYTKAQLESKYNSENLKEKGSLSLIKYTHKADNIYNYEWSNFHNIEQFGSYIINSKKFPIQEFIFRWSNDFQGIPRIQNFMNDHKNASKESYIEPRSVIISVIARPLLSILQEEFWRGLMESYFKFFHPVCILFSLVNFDPKTAPESLLSAIYFAGFITSANRSEDIRLYMNSYAIANIRKMLFQVNISSAKALGIYSFAFYLNGNSKLSRVCLSHFARMNHALGITVDRKNLPLLDQYNRKIVCNNMESYYYWAKLGPSSHEVACEDEESEIDIYDPKYQYPNSSLNLSSDEYLCTVYSVFCTQFAKLSEFINQTNSKFCKYETKRIKNEIEAILINANENYNDAKVTLESLIDLKPEYKCNTSIFLEMMKAPYIVGILCIYSKMLEVSQYRYSASIKDILDKSTELWDLLSSNSDFIYIYGWITYTLAFHLIQVYPYCSKKQKKVVVSILDSIINLYYKEGFNCNSTNFLILYTQFNLIKTN
jgi:hypothetical protein